MDQDLLKSWFMSLKCPSNSHTCRKSGRIVRFGLFYRKSDRRWIQRFKCTHCKLHFSQATSSPCYRQNKRQINSQVYELLALGVSQRGISRFLKIHMITVARKLAFLGLQARAQNLRLRAKQAPVLEFQFDDLETFEHTKLKPVSVTMAVEKHTRFILGFEVARMPAKGLLVHRALKKYGPRQDGRPDSRDRLFRKLSPHIAQGATIESDSNPHYPADVKRHFPTCEYKTYIGKRGCITGQGELKEGVWDPLFSLNHTYAMHRYKISRLIRKTWCTTKKIQPLIDHIDVYVNFHNRFLI